MRILCLLCFLVLVGCAPKYWYNKECNIPQKDRDLQECRYEGEKSAPPMTGSLAYDVSVIEKKNKIIYQCMTLRGYSLAEQSEYYAICPNAK